MYSEERKNIIRQVIKNTGKVHVSNLSKKLNVSEVTIRRDLADMEREGLLKRTFGGAVSLDLVAKAQPYSVKKEKNIAGKQLIAQMASKFITNGMTIFVDAGTTTAELVPYLLNYQNLFVFTVDLQIALSLCRSNKIDVYMIGGNLSHSTKSVNSVDSVLKLQALNFDLAFIGCDAFGLQGFETGTETKAQIKKSAISSSAVKILLADHQKYGQHSLFNFSNLDKLNYFITDYDEPEFFNKLSDENKKKMLWENRNE